MNKVSKYTIVGDGRLAKHFCFYFTQLQINFTLWSRKTATLSDLERIVENTDIVLILINDSAITEFSKKEFFKGKTLVHCSGSLALPHIHAAHPLMTFSDTLYDVGTYKDISFVLDKGGPEFSDLFPSLPNPSYRVDKSLRPFYHALCVCGGNFTTLLWQLVFKESHKKLDLPEAAYHLYMKQTLENLIKDSASALTGPFVRNDKETIEKNIISLEGSELLDIYQSFRRVFYSSP